MEDNDKKTSEADHAANGTNFSPDHHSTPTSSIRANTRDISATKYGRPNHLTDEENSATMNEQLRMRTWSMQNSSSTSSSNSVSRVDKYTNVQKIKSREDQHHLPRCRDTRRGGGTEYPNTHHSSLMTRHSPPASYGWYYGMTDEEYNFFMSREQLRMKSWPVQNSSSNFSSDSVSRVDEYTKVQEIKSRGDQHQSPRRRYTRRGGGTEYPNTHHSSLTTRPILPASYGWYYGMTDEEYNFFMSREQLRTRTGPMRVSSRNAYSDLGQRVDENAKVQEIKSKEDKQSQPGNRSRDITHPSAHQYSLNTRQLHPSSYGWYYGMTDEEYNFSMSRQQLRMRTGPMRGSSRNVYSDLGQRVDANTKVQEIKYRGNKQSQPGNRSRDIRRDGDITHPSAHQYSLNTRQIFPTSYGWYYGMTNEEYNFFMSRQQLRTRTGPLRVSSRNVYSDLGQRVDEDTKVQEIKSREDKQSQPRKRSMDTRRDGDITHPSAHQYSLNTSQLHPASYGWYYGMTGQEYNFSMSRQQLRTRPGPMRVSCRNAHSDRGSKVYEHTKVQEVKSRKDQHEFPRRGDTEYPNTHHSSPNTRQILPTSYGWQYGMTDEEYTLFMSGQQSRMRTWPQRDLGRNAYFDLGPRTLNYPKIREQKFRDDRQKLPQHKDPSCRNIMQPHIDQSSNTGTILPKRDGLQHRMREEYKLVVGRRQSRMRTLPMRNSSKNSYYDIGVRIPEHPEVQEIESREDQHQLPQHTGTRKDENTIHSNAYHSSNIGQTLPAVGGKKNRTTDECMGGQQLGMGAWPVRDSNRNTESDFRPRICENPPKEQEIKSSEGLRRRVRGNEGIKCLNDHPIDGKARKFVPAQELNPQVCTETIDRNQIRGSTRERDSNRDLESNIGSKILEEPTKEQVRESNEFWRSLHRFWLTGIIDADSSILYAKRTIVWFGLLRSICVLLLMAIIMFGIIFMLLIH